MKENALQMLDSIAYDRLDCDYEIAMDTLRTFNHDLVKWVEENDLESPLIFVLFLRVNKIRKKTLSVTPYFGKGDLRKTGSGSGVRLLIRNVR